MAARPGRRLNVNVTVEAHDAWLAFAKQHGVTFTALMEAIGQQIAAGTVPVLDDPQVLATAREIEVRRRHAPRPRPKRD